MRAVRLGRGPGTHRRRGIAVALPRPPQPARSSVRARGGMYVPSDSFGGQSPERKAAGILRTFFTFVAARVVLAQLEGSGRGALGAYDSQAATDLHHFLQNVPMRDGDEWLTQLMRKNTSLGLRLMEVRDSYCEEAFEWDQLQRLAKEEMKGANTSLMRRFAAASLAASLAEADGGQHQPASARSEWRSVLADDGGGGGDSDAATGAPAGATAGGGSVAPAGRSACTSADAPAASDGDAETTEPAEVLSATNEDGGQGNSSTVAAAASRGDGPATPANSGGGGAAASVLPSAPATPTAPASNSLGGDDGGMDGPAPV